MKEKQKYIITIDKPCHQEWSDMQNHSAGRFCGSCAKAVVDFTQLSDNEIIRILENTNGKSLCGRFEKEQLNKIMVQTSAEKNNPALYKILAGLLLLASVETAVGQNTPFPKDPETVSETKNQIKGEIAVATLINGTITDQKGKAISGATVFLQRANESVVTDKNGKFSISGYNGEKLRVNKNGYETQTIEISGRTLKITLKKAKAVAKDKKTVTRNVIMGDVAYATVPKKVNYIIDGVFVENFKIETIGPARIQSISILKEDSSEMRSNNANETYIVKTDLSNAEKKLLNIKTK